MAITLSSDFIEEQIKLGSSPVFLVEIQSAGRFFATREPEFSGKWTVGDGLLVGSGILVNDDYPVYDGGLSQLADGGISEISMTLDFQSGLALTGNSAVSILNQTLFSHITDDIDLTNAKIRVRLGFFGFTFQQYVTIFAGAIEEFQSTLETMELSLIDDTLANLVPVPPQTGSDFLPQALTVGQAIPIIMGDVDLVPNYQLVDDTTSTLLIAMGSGDDQLFLADVGARFPREGEVTIEAEVMTYSGVSTVVVGQQQSLRLNNLVRSAGVAHAARTLVTLTSFNFEYLLGFEAQSVRRIRAANGTAPTTTVTPISRALDPLGRDPRRITVLSTATEEDVTATVAGQFRDANMIENGEGEGDPATFGWTVTAGAWATSTNLGEPAIRGTVVTSQALDSEMYQDITTNDAERYRLTASVTLDGVDTPPFATIRVGTPASPALVFDFGEVTTTTEQGLDLTFAAPAGGTTRITLVVNSDTPGASEHAYFDHIDVYSLTSENPATQIENLINEHMGNQKIAVNRETFDAAFAVFDAEGDRLAGVIDSTQEGQGLLGRLAFQYRSKTFLDESGEQKLVPFNNQALPLRNVTPSDVDKGTFNVSLEPEEKVFTRFYVYFNRRADVNQGNLGGRESYQNVLFATPEETNSVESGALQFLCKEARDNFRVDRSLEIFADMIPDAATADRLLSHIVRLHTIRRVLARFTSYINLVEVEIADVIRIQHPLLPPSTNNRTFEVIEKTILPNGCQVAFTCAEIRQSQYDIYIETWTPPARRIPSLQHDEQWSQLPGPVILTLEDDGTPILCNPWVEHWSPSVATRDERLEYYYSESPIGLGNVELSRSLIAAFDGFFTPPTPSGNLVTSVALSNQPPAQTGLLGNTSTQILTGGSELVQSGTPRMFMQAGHDYQNEALVSLGIPEPTAAAKFPVQGIGLGPGGNDAHLFINNNTDTRAVLQRIRMSSCVRWLETDFTANFWLYQSEKGSSHRPFFGSRSIQATPAGTIDDDRIAFLMWWDHTDDRWHLVADYFVSNGANVTPDYNAHVALLRAHGDHVTHTTLGAPALNTWYMVTLRWDLSTLTLDWAIDADAVNEESLTLGGTPTQDTFRTGNQLLWMADDRLQRLNALTPDSFGMNGRLAQMHMWSRRLTDGELTSLYNSGSSLPYPYV